MKQVIVVRKDLTMGRGKIASQVAHASVGIVVDNPQNGYIQDWLATGMTKIVVGCDSEDELLQLQEQAKQAGVITCLVTDAGRTEFKEPTRTVIAIGPDQDFRVDELTGDLKLL